MQSNPNRAAQDNRANQLNPNNPRHAWNVSVEAAPPGPGGGASQAVPAGPAGSHPGIPLPSGSPTQTQARPRCRSPTHRQGGNVGYQGQGTKADLDNHAKQLNPNNPLYQPRGGK
jgi:hypothetical protein